MDEALLTELIYTIEMDPVQWDQLVDLFSTSITVSTTAFIMLCVVAGILLGQIMWRWMK